MTGGKELLQILGLATASAAVIAISGGGNVFGILGFAGLGLAGLAVYLFPAIVGWEREHPNQVSIALLNFFLGWTFLGWVGSLVWAYSSIPKTNIQAAETE